MHDDRLPFPVERLLRPRSVAIVGISPDPGSMGHRALTNLRSHGFAGEVHLVSRSNRVVGGLTCAASIDDLPQGVDAMILALPAAAVPEAVESAARRGVGGIVAFAAGFGEAGEEGARRQARMADSAREAGMALLGPNTLGLTNFVAGIPLGFTPSQPDRRNGRPSLAIISQSGAMAGSARLSSTNRGLFVSYSIATGNEAVTGVEDYLAALIDDAATDAITIYAEQLRRPGLFLTLAAKARAAGKPIIMLHPGRSAKAREAAASHTGALSGDYPTMRALVASEAVVLVETLDDWFDAAELLARNPDPPKRGIGMMTDSGACRGLSLDQADMLGCDLPALAASTSAALAERLPGFAEVGNPLDITAQGLKDMALYGAAAELMLSDGNCGSVLVAVMPGAPEIGLAKASAIVPALAASGKPSAFVLLGGAAPIAPEVPAMALAAGLPFFRSLERALRALAHVNAYALLKQAAGRPRAPRAQAAVPISGDGYLVEYESKALLARHGIVVPQGSLARTPQEAVAIAEQIGWPVVLKAQAADLPHKTEVSGVLLGVPDAAHLRAGWALICARVAEARQELALDGLLVESNAPAGVELVVGGRNDPQWGPLLVFGLGGIWTEALRDIRIAPADMSADGIKSELARLAGAMLLTGFRGGPCIDLDLLADTICRIGLLLRQHPEIAEIDVNPLMAYPVGRPPVALDALILRRPCRARMSV